MPLLAREREVVAVDMPGFGASPRGPGTVEGLAEALAEFAAGLGLERPHVAGNSLGGGGRAHHGRHGRGELGLRRFADGVRRRPREGRTRARCWSTTRVVAERLAPVAPTLARSAVLRTLLSAHIAARPWRIPAEDAAHWMRMCARGARRSGTCWRRLDGWRAPAPACPTTVAWGERDRLLIFSRQAPRARRGLPEARHVVLRGCGHVPTWDDPEQVAHVLLSASRPAEAPRRSAPGYSSPPAPRCR